LAKQPHAKYFENVLFGVTTRVFAVANRRVSRAPRKHPTALFTVLGVVIHVQPCPEYFVCDRCVEIDDQTVRYQELAKSISDKAALESIARLIAALAAEKLGLHPESEK
jgi:hypothetical protein